MERAPSVFGFAPDTGCARSVAQGENDVFSKTWIVDSFHVTPIKECFTNFHEGSHGHVYLGNNHACSIEGIGTMHLDFRSKEPCNYKVINI